MRPASECYDHADYCEKMAWAAGDDINRRFLLSTAAIWRSLGDSAGRHQRIVAASYAVDRVPSDSGRLVSV